MSRSPGSAPCTWMGPDSTCTLLSGALRMSSAESSLWIAPSNHSRQSTRNESPGLTCTRAGTSGCQRLWPTICWSVNVLVLSSGKTFWGIGLSLLSGAGNEVGEPGPSGDGGVVARGGGGRRGRGLPASPRDQGEEDDDAEDREADREGDSDLRVDAGEQQERRDPRGHPALDGAHGAGVAPDP